MAEFSDEGISGRNIIEPESIAVLEQRRLGITAALFVRRSEGQTAN